LTSRLWISTELYNKSDRPLTYMTSELVQFIDKSCLEDQKFESTPSGTLAPEERRVIRYTFKLYSGQKYSPEYERCRKQPLKFQIGGLTLGTEPVTPTTFTIEN